MPICEHVRLSQDIVENRIQFLVATMGNGEGIRPSILVRFLHPIGAQNKCFNHPAHLRFAAHKLEVILDAEGERNPYVNFEFNRLMANLGAYWSLADKGKLEIYHT